MTKGLKYLLIFLGFIGMVFISYKNSYPTYSWHQKMTVEVETPEGVVSGSSVVEAKIEFRIKIGAIGGGYKSWQGEATIVSLPNEKYLFILLSDPVTMAQESFKVKVLGDPNARIDKSYLSKLEALRESALLLRDHYPLFVTFDDLDDPASVKAVDPDDLAATFGEGYVLKSVILEITDEEVSEGRLVELLPWLREYINQRLDGSRFGSIKAENRFANSLSAGSFKIGGLK